MKLPILKFPDDKLRTKASKVETIDDTIKTLVKDMFETMYDSDGIGLAATQVNQHLQVVVMDVPDSGEDYQLILENRTTKNKLIKKHPLCFINPTITKKEEKEIHTEGCLSVPNFYAKVERFNHIVVEALDENGDPFTLEARNLLAVCIQHELDHLQGILFIDYLSKLKQKRLLERIKKQSL
ncbi:peptide deformylase [bacterium endosymbiont of Bathymodiolus sp. 5 South]|jgi:peptide deformylase|uniref:peptide deformylase n=1 Tax=bacterium endosymbiont of Bathymodiolus sp. 5 South TaxID=1181670 RepID=UPI0010BB8110|nr:Peptide deformylase (EC 3.5.1.88) [uncultured Gammaproteobacteria bacterium]SHN92661.1 Peptide deformylase [bacterium endosymbiont of Bathymodiolus sp. 5 South]SSC07938.1 Peptide deformylase [bacterium endosymbiont of Bathymodiolus sp. 5 South]VVH59627.1 Peptide deformylase (EC [uncultured Gammaproteobacteria bacterium]VVH63028.1 Peptide deformylase (EC [uncultured Gammaproteobacteria bacterium]